jgi:uncharacterized protein
MLGILQNEAISEILSTQYIGRIGCYAQNQIYVVPITYVYAENTIFCYSNFGMKIKMMRQNPYVCFEVDDLSDMGNWKSVICWGNYEEVKTTEDKEAILARLLSHVHPLQSGAGALANSNPLWPFAFNEIKTSNGIFFRLNIEEVTGRYAISEYKETPAF